VIVDYKRLDNPFSDSKDDEDSMIAIYLMINDESYTAATNDGPISLKEAKQSPDWPEWEKAIQAELEQLQDMGTWVIVKKPLDAIPITNKWLFIRKTNNIRQIDKYKARLVIKGCSQQPSFDYNETYSSVVRLEMVRTILSMVPNKDLRIQQMDVKGAYLNSILKEDVYMCQPEGYRDGSDKVCQLIIGFIMGNPWVGFFNTVPVTREPIPGTVTGGHHTCCTQVSLRCHDNLLRVGLPRV
jgi:hypothetical protein